MLKELKNVGLGDKEAKTYVAMLELGPATMQEIAAKAGINRPTAYVQVEALKAKGLVSTQTRGKKQYFFAESPSQLEHFLGKEQKEIDLRKMDLGKVLPDLLAMHALGDEKPIVRYFEGIEGVQQMLHHFLNSGAKAILSITAADDVLRLFPQHQKNHTPRRVQKGIYSRLIYTSEQGAILRSDPKLLRETRFIHPDKLPFNAEIEVYGPHISISSFRGRIGGAIITHEVMARSIEALLELVWNSLPAGQ